MAKFQIDEKYSAWWSLPEPILFKIFLSLPIRNIVKASEVCKRWNEVANDNFLWRKKFQSHYKTDPGIALKPGAESWKSEYIRLTTKIPFVQTQSLRDAHAHQVLHVSFSHNGEMFATCSKDGYVIIWNAGHPCNEKYAHNMKQFSWKYTQYSQFNQTDTLLLVSGVHFGSPHSTSGEIAVFTVGGESESHLRCRILNRPYDIFGTWFSDQYLISGGLQWLAHLISTSLLWLNKANQEVDSEHVPIMDQLYKFYNRNASSARSIMIAKCNWLDDSNDPLKVDKEEASSTESTIKKDNQNCDKSENPSTSISVGNPPSYAATHRFSSISGDHQPSTSRSASAGVNKTALPSGQNIIPDLKIRYSEEYRSKCTSGNAGDEMHTCFYEDEDTEEDENESEDELMDATAEYDEMENSIPKYLIFSTGSKTYTPHEIGIKRVKNIRFPKTLDPGLSLKERIAAKRAAQQQQQNEPQAEPDWWNYEAVAHRFDQIDKVIDLHGHIIGMALSPDHRYLYVNTRPWPENYVINNPLEPPPIAQEIDIHVIDLMTLKSVGNMLRAHKAYTPSTECFFIFLDVSEDYVASGAEDRHAYIWDRYYGVCLAKYKHADVVNSVAFNPRDPEMLVTTSDDYTIKIWRSRSKAKKLELNFDTSESFELKKSST